MRGRNDAYIDRNRFFASDPRDFLLLQRAEQRDLRMRSKVCDLVEKQCTVVGQFKFPQASPMGTGECSFFVPK